MFGRAHRPERVPSRRPLFALALALALVIQSASPAAAAVGDLDDTFAGNGKLLLNLSSGSDYVEDVVVQPGDQKIVGVGQLGLGEQRFAVLRWNPDGNPDGTFGGGDGRVFTTFGTFAEVATAVALQADGKIVAVGYAPGSGGQFAIARYNTDGSPDMSFSGDGKTTTNFTSGDDFAWDVAIQPADQKIVVAGRTAGSDPKFAVVRYNTNGSLDGTFSGDGRATVNLTTGEDNGTALALQANGGIVLVGYASGLGGQIGVARLTASGVADTSFSGDGKLVKNLTTGEDFAWDVAIQPADQRIVLAGRSGQGAGSLVAVRYNPDGSLDSSFSGDGVVAIGVTSFDDWANALALQADGKIVLAGTSDGEFFVAARLTTVGTIDASFAHDGTAVVNISSGPDFGRAVAIQADGGVIVGGQATGGGGKIALIRLLGS